jgi:hypothetical protein
VGALSTLHEQQTQRAGFRPWSRGRWLLVAGLIAAIVVAVILIVMYTGGGSGGGGGY